MSAPRRQANGGCRAEGRRGPFSPAPSPPAFVPRSVAHAGLSAPRPAHRRTLRARLAALRPRQGGRACRSVARLAGGHEKSPGSLEGNRGPGRSASATLGCPARGPGAACALEVPTRTPPPQNRCHSRPRDHLLRGASHRHVGSQPARPPIRPASTGGRRAIARVHAAVRRLPIPSSNKPRPLSNRHRRPTAGRRRRRVCRRRSITRPAPRLSNRRRPPADGA